MDPNEHEGLSPEEVAALEGSDQDQTDEILEAVAGKGGDEEIVVAPAGEGAETPAPAPGGEAAVAAPVVEPVAAAVAEPVALALPEIDDIVVPENIPVVRFQFVDDGKILPEFANKFADLDAKYEASELTLGAYNTERDALKAEMNGLKSSSQLWQAECDTFCRNNKDWAPGTPLYDMLNGEVVRLAAHEKAHGLSGIELIYAAQLRVSQAIQKITGVPQPAVPVTPTPGKETARPESPRPAPATHVLGALPAAAAPEVGGGEFAHLATLTGLDLERAVAAMSPEQRERWATEN